MANQAERAGVNPSDNILAEMQAYGSTDPSINDQAREDLGRLTRLLVSNDLVAAESEYERFIQVQDRNLEVDASIIRSAIEGRRILVTGGTGCIGKVLLSQLLTLNPAQVVSLESSAPPSDTSDVEYASIDLRNGDALRAKLSVVKPDVIFHLAAQRNIATAQESSLPTLTTNISGTHNLIEAAEQVEAAHIVYASSDKALPPLVDGTYAVSKKAGEWLMSEVASRGRMICTAARLTHVVDNSVIFDHLHKWATTDATIRLFNPDISMNIQSATEAAQLILGSCLEGEPGYLKVQTLGNVDRPINLLRLALGTIARFNSSSPIHFRDARNKKLPQLGVFQPSVKAPLIGEFEIQKARPASFCDNVASLPANMRAGHELENVVKWLSENGHNDVSQNKVSAVESSLSWNMFEAILQGLDKETLDLALYQAKSLPRSNESARIASTIQTIVNE